MTAARLLSCSGDKCITTTKASPLLAGICSKNCRNTAIPPADAPRPTTPVGVLFPPGRPFVAIAFFLGESGSAGIYQVSSTCDLVLHHAANRRGTQLRFPTTVEFQRFSISAFSRTGPLHLEGHLRINAVRGKFFPIHGGAEFLHVNGANVAQCLGGFLDYILRCFLPASRRFRKYLNYFYDLWHELDSLPLPFRAASGIWPQDRREEASGSSHWAIVARATSKVARDLGHARLITPAKFG